LWLKLQASVRLVYAGLNEVNKSLNSLKGLVDCRDVHTHYTTVLTELCHTSLYVLVSLHNSFTVVGKFIRRSMAYINGLQRFYSGIL
jgi:hypothetical protein